VALPHLRLRSSIGLSQRMADMDKNLSILGTKSKSESLNIREAMTETERNFVGSLWYFFSDRPIYNESSRPAELPRQPLSEPYVTVSRHTALLVPSAGR